ncbi:sigma-E factor regulatory protein RseB [Yersinia pekkanenii]|uniref:Periplasmic negative regulator of sigmaE n=1 Tax=Yersinia pekkanenii TaxID=1288385 RepID=A0A0T9NCT7_9GAMM|nr:sigma-E factor regulatory protein RseB [Yersinia pekkanenii]CNG99986.1 periplasmic negative regulator of sigmaE [Yersinia pekkanenii]CRY64128.1 periplasmic negative regulator of sigmaE [Yersinia pekkanenii]
MKQFWFSVCLMAGGLLMSTIASAETAPIAMLQEMSSASRSLNYELSYINVNKQGIDSLRYRHAILDKKTLAQLLRMDGPRTEILQRGNEISYFEPGFDSFTLGGEHIVDALPSVVFPDFEKLSKYYNYIALGRARVADRPSQVIRVVARDSTRYSYIIWMDETSKLPMRIDLLDKDGETLEQFRVISFAIGEPIQQILEGLLKLSLPPLLALPAKTKVDFTWAPRWLPDGVTEVSRSRRTLPNMDTPTESRLYSDGLFSFSVNVNPVGKDALSEQSLRQGRRTVHTEARNNVEITVVGELPPSTAKRIADSVVLESAK